MLIDARQIPNDTEIEGQVCIIGAGAAGITLARELADLPFKVCVLESGGLELDQETQDLYRGEVELLGRDIDTSRLRFFGGTTNHWGGFCRPLDPDVFEARAGVPHGGWPITRADLDPYYERAHEILVLGRYDYDPISWSDSMPRFFQLPIFGDRLRPAIWQKSPPVRFGQTYRADLEDAPNVEAYLYANVVDIETDETASVVQRLRVACLNGNSFWVKGSIFILATGAIENARVLLAAHKVEVTGLGNGNDLVGRYFMEHLDYEAAAQIMLSEPSDVARQPISAAGEIRTRVMLTAETAAQEGLLKSAVDVADGEVNTSRLTQGSNALRRMLSALKRGHVPDDLLEDLGQVIGDLDGIYTDFNKRFRDTSLLQLAINAEQAPNPDSRVVLTNQRDALGMQRAKLAWRLTTQEKTSIRRGLEIIGEEVGRAGIGRLRIDEWFLDDDVSSYPGGVGDHHMGTTRMTDDPKTGVVDADGRVHSVRNLYVAGSSVFPTGGVSNPTLTVVALAVRLADHVKALMA